MSQQARLPLQHSGISPAVNYKDIACTRAQRVRSPVSRVARHTPYNCDVPMEKNKGFYVQHTIKFSIYHSVYQSFIAIWIKWNRPVTEPIGTQMFFLCRKVPFNTGTFKYAWLWLQIIRPAKFSATDTFPLCRGSVLKKISLYKKQTLVRILACFVTAPKAWQYGIIPTLWTWTVFNMQHITFPTAVVGIS